MNNFKAITIQVFETPDIFQHVHGWPTEVEPGVIEVEIRMPLFVTPSCIMTDVREALNENGFKDYGLKEPVLFEIINHENNISI